MKTKGFMLLVFILVQASLLIEAGNQTDQAQAQTRQCLDSAMKCDSNTKNALETSDRCIKLLEQCEDDVKMCEAGFQPDGGGQWAEP